MNRTYKMNRTNKMNITNKMNRTYKIIDINKIKHIPTSYPTDFNIFCDINKLYPPNINSKSGIALSVMLNNKYYYWNRYTCNLFVKKFKIKTDDSIQLFNKHSQWGIQTNSGIEKGKLYIIYPYQLSNKHNIRNNINIINKCVEIEKIKSTIINDYIEVCNSLWQCGHKNPCLDLSNDNLVLQPPIQGKYRDNYIFIDTITKIPMPNKLETIIENKEIQFTKEQLINYKNVFDKLIKKIENS